jgi:hypothetical protein
MSKDPTRKPDRDVSRRGLLEKAALAVGAATSVVAARSALARSSDVVMDSAGRVLIGGSTLAVQRPEGSFEEAAVRKSENNSCTNSAGCTGGTNTGCNNTKGCAKASPTRAIQPTGAVPKTNAPMGVTGGGRSRK